MFDAFLGKAKVPALRVPWKIRDSFIVFFVAWLGAELVALIALKSLAHRLAWAQTAYNALLSGNIYASFTTYLLSAIIGLSLVAYFVRRNRASLADLGLRPFNVVSAITLILAIYIGFSIMIGFLFVLITVLVPSFNANQAQSNDFTTPATGVAAELSLFALVIVPAVLEEVVFRGFMFSAMATRWGTVGGAVASSALFALAHGQWNAIVYTFVLGLLLCLMYRRLGSIWPGMLLHAINNYIAFSALVHK